MAVDFGRSALLIIDMQRDFLEPDGFGAALGNDVSLLARAVEPCRAILHGARAAGVPVLHTREGHRPDLSDAPRAKVERGPPEKRIGAVGPMGRILIRGEAGHAIIPALLPLPSEPVIDKPGKGAFYQTDLELMLRTLDIETLIVAGVTTEVCVHSTVREANDRGFRCLVLGDACASYKPGISRGGIAHDRRAGRHLRLGHRYGQRPYRPRAMDPAGHEGGADTMSDTKPVFNAALHLDAMAATMGLTITPDQRPGVLQYLNVARAMADVVAKAPLAADAFDLAPVFRPGTVGEEQGDA